MRRTLALPTLLVVLAVVILAARAPEAIEHDPDRAPATTSERVIAYTLTEAGGPRFLLAGGPELVRLTVHLVLPPGPYAPGRRYAFDLAATLRDPDGAVRWRRIMSERAGHTKAAPRPDGFAYEAAYAPDRRFELSDAATVELPLPDAPPGSILDLRLSGQPGLLAADGVRVVAPLPDARALVRAHRRVDPELARETLRRSATAAALGSARPGAATFLPWHALDKLARVHAEADAWGRLPAEGQVGRDYVPESIYVAVGPPPPPPAPEAPALAIAAAQSAVVHLLGPGSATVRARSAEPVSTDTPQLLALRTTWLGEIGPDPAPPGAPGPTPEDLAFWPSDREPVTRDPRTSRPARRPALDPRTSRPAVDPRAPRASDAAAGPPRASSRAADDPRTPRASDDTAGPPRAASHASAASPGSPGRSPQAADLRPGDPRAATPVLQDIPATSELRAPVAAIWQEERFLLPPGWTSLELSTDLAGVEVQVLAEDGARHAGATEARLAPATAPEPPRPPSFRTAPSLATPAPPPAALVPVDLRTLPLYRLGPDVPAVDFDLAGPGDVYARTLRLDVRALDVAAPVRVRVEFLADDGRVLADDELVAEPQELARFDRVRPPSPFGLEPEQQGDGDHAPLLVSTLGLPLAERPVTDAASLRLLAPPAARRARVAADVAALLEVRGVLPPPLEELVASPWIWPYDRVCPEGQRWRYATRRRDRWFPLRVADLERRLREGLVVPLQAQVRREPDPPNGDAEGPWESLVPRAAGSSLEILERVVAARRAQAIAGWGPGDVTLLRPGVRERLDLRRGGPGSPYLRYHVLRQGTGTLGQPIELTINDAPTPWQVTSRAEARRLPRSRPIAAVVWSSGPDPLRMFSNRPGLDGAPLYAARRIFRLAHRPLVVPVVKRTRSTEPVHVVVYWLEGQPREPTTLRVLLDGGAPRRHGGGVARVTQAERAFTVAPDRPAEILLADRETPLRAHVATFTLRLGDDLAPGRHVLTLARASGPPLWIRLFRGAPRRNAPAPVDPEREP